MGHFISSEAKAIQEPHIISLSGNPNYLQLKLNNSVSNNIADILLEIVSNDADEDITNIVITDYESNKYSFKGTRDISKVSDNVFFLHYDPVIIAENIRMCLISNAFLRANFKVTILNFGSGNTIRITPIGAGNKYNLKIDCNSKFIHLVNPIGLKNEIDENYEIRVDLYKNTGIFLGNTSNDVEAGTYLTTLSKNYNIQPVWFDLNTLFGKNRVFSNSFLRADGWCDTGTLTDYRAIVRKSDGINTKPLYVSDILYTITGYIFNYNINDLTEYVYDTHLMNIVKPLTNRPPINYIKGEKQYFNFILSDPDRDVNLGSDEYEIGIIYRLYTQSYRFIAEIQKHNQNRKLFNVVNTIGLDIDGAIESYDNIGIVEVYLSRSGSPISKPLFFHILPEWLYTVKDFAFLNSFGGWDSFNFGGSEKKEFKTEATTIFKTRTPVQNISSEIESVYSKTITEQFVVTSNPISKDIVEWLQELSLSHVVYELSTMKVVIIDDLTLKSNAKDDLFIVEMKYHYSNSMYQ